MREIFEKLYDLMDGRKIIVMPSEDARRRLLSSYALSRKRTVSASLAISTDTFISLFFPDRDAKPIDQATRLSFSSYLLFSKRELLSYFVPPSLSQELLPRMVRFIASLLPHLEDDGIVPFKKANDDLENIKKEYMLFLERMNLYEPSFISGGVELDGPYVLFHPECNLPLSSFLEKAGKLGLFRSRCAWFVHRKGGALILIPRDLPTRQMPSRIPRGCAFEECKGDEGG